ncbi:MAG: hypothetical protein AAGE01_16195 [Pseudomonadota bacterium]
MLDEWVITGMLFVGAAGWSVMLAAMADHEGGLNARRFAADGVGALVFVGWLGIRGHIDGGGNLGLAALQLSLLAIFATGVLYVWANAETAGALWSNLRFNGYVLFCAATSFVVANRAIVIFDINGGSPFAVPAAFGTAVAYFLLMLWLRRWLSSPLARVRARLSSKPMILLLRPFDATEVLDAPKGFEMRRGAGAPKSAYSILPILVRGLNRLGIVVTLGKVKLPSWRDSVAAITLDSSDADWVGLFRRLAEHSGLVIIIPFDSPGVVAELRHLLENETARHKSFIFVPPVLPNQDAFRSVSKKEEVDRKWDAVDQFLRDIGVSLRRNKGSLISLGSREIFDLEHADDPGRLDKEIARVLAEHWSPSRGLLPASRILSQLGRAS